MKQGLPLFPESASTFSGQVDALYLFLVAMSAFFVLLIAASVIYCAIRFRRRSEDEIGSTFHANLALELTWTIIPLVIVLGIFYWGTRVAFVQFRPPADAMEILGVGKQWMWKFQHPEGQMEINSLHVPVGQPVRLRLISEDVIHSFFVPAFRTKMDVLPGRYTTFWFEATRPGRYHLFCAEYCGTEHARMIGHVVALDPQDYERWLAGAIGEVVAPEEAGALLFAQLGCNTCHTELPGARGPFLRGLYGSQVTLDDGRVVVADDAYIRRSILDPMAEVTAGWPPIMPSYRGQISEENLFRLIAYIRSLGETPRPGVAAPMPAPVTEPPEPDTAPDLASPEGQEEMP
jgi:cytochrome c oxidase subunit II